MRRVATRVACAIALIHPLISAAQVPIRAEDSRLGGEESRYLRALAVLGPVGAPSQSIRPALDESRLRALQSLGGPWRLDPTVRGLSARGGEVDIALNSGLPTQQADGPAWSGRGGNVRVMPMLDASRGRLRVRVAPVLWWAQNAAFELAPTTGPFPWSDAARGGSFDLPQRFGDASLARIDPGESSLSVSMGPMAVSLTSAAARIGAGSDHALILQGDNGGIPRLEIGVPRGVMTPIGRFGLLVAWGRSAHTAWAPQRRNGGLYTSYSVVTLQPRFAERLDVGLVRLFHRDWEDLRVVDLLVPFGSLHQSRWAGGDSAADNQLGSLFATLRVPEAGLEFYGEWGRNDRARDLREVAIELEHNAAWLLGAQKVWRDAGARLWAINATAIGGSISPISPFRSQAFFYEHSPLVQGHTLRGQLLGTSLLQREGGGELRIDRYDESGRVGLVLGTRALPNVRAVDVPPDQLRQEWSAAVEWTRFTPTGVWRTRIGGVADLGFAPGRDIYSLNLGIGYSARR